MNYLAHLYLAERSTDSLIGNLLGDFVKGRLRGQYNAAIMQGIALHRKIDTFTDAHAITRSSRKLISPGRRRFAGIIVDLGYDHFLARHWHRYTDVELSSFVREVYRTLEHRSSILPDNLQHLLPRMTSEDWLNSYKDLSGIASALDRISMRFKRTNSLMGSVEEIERHYECLQGQFLEFFPQVIRFAKQNHFTDSAGTQNARRLSENSDRSKGKTD